MNRDFHVPLPTCTYPLTPVTQNIYPFTKKSAN